MGRGPRKWVKLYCYEILHGSVSYQLSEAEQAVWVKLLCLAGLCGNEGVIADHDLRAFPHTFICHEIHTDPDVFEETLRKCKEEGRISEDGQGIRITNWAKYQSEYDRQKPWREKQKRLQYMTPEERVAYFSDPARAVENTERDIARRAIKGEDMSESGGDKGHVNANPRRKRDHKASSTSVCGLQAREGKDGLQA